MDFNDTMPVTLELIKLRLWLLQLVTLNTSEKKKIFTQNNTTKLNCACKMPPKMFLPVCNLNYKHLEMFPLEE